MRKSLALLCLLLATTGSFAQLVWEKVNLPPEFPVVFTSPRNIVYVANVWKTKMIYRSFDEGATWDSLITPFTSPYIRLAAVDSSGVIYAQSSDTLWISTDDGVSWEFRKHFSGHGQYLLASRDSLFLFSYGPWVRVSSDQGETWSDHRHQTNGSDIGWAGAAISPQGNAFGFFQFDGSVRLMGGPHFPAPIRTKFGLLFIPDNDPISWMMFDQEGFGYGEHNGMLIRSSNGGLNWEPIDSSTNPGILTRYWGPYGARKGGGIIAVSDTETVLSIDQTSIWMRVGEGVRSGYSKVFATTRRGTIFLQSDSGVFRTSHFAAIKQQMPSTSITIGFDHLARSVTVNAPDATSSIRLIVSDIIGRVVVQEILRDKNEHRIDLSMLQAGTYMVAAVSKTSVVSTVLSLYK